MANKGRAYGLSRECQLKTVAKFDMGRTVEAITWLEKVLGRTLMPPSGTFKDQREVKELLKDGQVLCDTMNTIYPGSIRKVNRSSFAFKEMENIEMFLRACRNYGMNEVDVFQTQDLYETKSMYTVINCIHSLGSLAKWNGYYGPTIGVKLAKANRRSFSEEQVQEGRKFISLQYGTNKVASQAGMTPYGAQRKM